MLDDRAAAVEGSENERATLRRLIRSLEQAQRLANLGSWEWDLECDVLSWSDEVFRILGLEPCSVAPSYDLLLELTHPDDRERVSRIVAASMESEDGTYDADYRVCWPDGTVRHIHALGAVTRDDEGRLLRMLGTVLDVTERVEALAINRARSEELAVALRQVEEAAAAERRAVERERRFLSAVSHELRTPLTVIRGVASTLPNVEDPDVRRSLQNALSSHSTRLHGLIDDLLLVAEGDFAEVRRVRAPVADVVARAVASIPAATSITTRVVDLDMVFVEPRSLGRALYAMLHNAARFGGEGDVELALRGEGPDVVIEVGDHGPGVPEAIRSAVFEPFRRGASKVEHAPGTGVGLTVVQLCAGIHDGCAEIVDRPGGGALVRLRLGGARVLDESPMPGPDPADAALG